MNEESIKLYRNAFLSSVEYYRSMPNPFGRGWMEFCSNFSQELRDLGFSDEEIDIIMA